jgi:1-acyl-sn-glycerol-3-phosphate acyltransferase
VIRRAPERELPAGLRGRATARAGITYRLLRIVWRALAAVLRLHIVVEGAERLPRTVDGRPAGGWIAAGLPHRTWIDPFIPWIVLPPEPRLAFFGDARTMARSPVRRFVLDRLGGVIPIPAGHDRKTVDVHLEAARHVLDAGAVFCLFPETGPAAPLGSIRRLGGGIGYVALRNGAAIVPLVIGGNDELYLGRRIVVRILPPLDPLALAGLASPEEVPPAESAQEREAVHRILAGLALAVADDVRDVHRLAEPPSGFKKRGRFLTTLFR